MMGSIVANLGLQLLVVSRKWNRDRGGPYRWDGWSEATARFISNLLSSRFARNPVVFNVNI